MIILYIDGLELKQTRRGRAYENVDITHRKAEPTYVNVQKAN